MIARKRALFLGLFLLAASVTFFGSSSFIGAQEKFKGSVTVFTRPPKKSYTAKRPAPERIPAAAIEANARGNEHFDAKRYSQAIDAYKEAIKIHPRYAESYLNLGDVFRELRWWDSAVDAYKEALRLKPNDADANNGLGDAYEGLGRPDEATAAYRRANTGYNSAGILNDKAISLGRPVYPPIAKSVNAAGKVVVRVLIDESGQVIRAEALNGHALLVGAAVRAASESVFAPAMANGYAVKISGLIIYNFPPE